MRINNDFKKKLSYIWDYYKLWIITTICVLSLVFYIGYKMKTTLSDHWCYIGFVGTNADVGNASGLWKGYVEETGFDLGEKQVEFNNQFYFDYTDNQARGNKYFEIFVAYLDSGIMDACTMEKQALTDFGASGRLLDLNREECSTIREKYGDRFVYTLPYDTEYSEEEVPVGIDISDSSLMKDYKIYDETCVLGISAGTENIEAVEAFLDYVFKEEVTYARADW